MILLLLCGQTYAGLKKKKKTTLLSGEIVLDLRQVCLAASRSGLEASSQQAAVKSWAFCVLALRMLRGIPHILKTFSIYFDPVDQLSGLYFKERIEQVHEDVREKMFIVAIYNHENVKNNLNV